MVGLTSNTSGGFTFGQTSTVAPVGGFSFGQTPVPSATPSQPILGGFGATSVPGGTTQVAPFSGFGLSSTTTQAMPFSGFGLSTATPASQPAPFSGFGLSTATTTNQSTPFGATPQATVNPLLPGTSTNTVSSGFSLNFEQKPTTTTSPFGIVTSTTGSGLGTGLFTIPTATSCVSALPTSTSFSFTASGGSGVSGVGLGGLVSSPVQSIAGGLGGFQLPSSSSASVGTGGKLEGTSTKEAFLPQEIFATISPFEEYKESEKKACEENVRQTATPFHKLGENTQKLKEHVLQLANKHAQLHATALNIKAYVMQEAENVEMACRTQDTAMNLQGDNKAPEHFFLSLVKSFEERMQRCRLKIEEVEKCASAHNMNNISSEDMKEVLRHEHEALKVLAARVYALHSQLLDLCKGVEHPSVPQPELLFRESHQLDTNSNALRSDSILRPCLGDGGSGLLAFQSGQYRAKALALGAAPPTMPLNQSSTSLFGSLQPSFLHSATPFASSSLNTSAQFGNNTSLNFGNTASPSFSNFGNAPLSFGANQPASPFGTSGGSLFGTGGATPFALAKPITKSFDKEDESQRKRRLKL